MTITIFLLLTLGLLVYVFSPVRRLAFDPSPTKTRLAHLYERKDVVYDNLRDLNFEYKAGKLDEADYATLRASLEDEAAAILREIEHLEALEGQYPRGARA